jgi:hypothetical protein
MRKQRSFSRRSGGSGSSGEPRTPSGTFAATDCGGGGGGGGGFSLDFVNFTPNDKNVLMTGVAPSGSSKTKARREKEAMENTIKAVRDAGGDVNRLMGGFVV